MTYKLYVKNYQSIPLGLLISKYPCTILSNLIYYVQGVKGESLFLFCHFNNNFSQSPNRMNQKSNLFQKVYRFIHHKQPLSNSVPHEALTALY